MPDRLSLSLSMQDKPCPRISSQTIASSRGCLPHLASDKYQPFIRCRLKGFRNRISQFKMNVNRSLFLTENQTTGKKFVQPRTSCGRNSAHRADIAQSILKHIITMQRHRA